MKSKTIIITTLILISMSCQKKDDIADLNGIQNYKVFGDELKCKPIQQNNTFIFAVMIDSAYYITKIDEYGQKTTLFALKDFFPPNYIDQSMKNLSVFNGTESKFFAVFTYNGYAENDTLVYINVIQYDISGFMMNNSICTLQSYNSTQNEYFKVISNQSNELIVMSSSTTTPTNPPTSKHKFLYFDNTGKFKNSYDIQNFTEQNIMEAGVNENGNIYVFTISGISPGGGGGGIILKKMYIFDNQANIVNTVTLNTKVENVQNILVEPDRILMTGTKAQIQTSDDTYVSVIDMNGGILWETTFTSSLSVFNILKTSNGYLFLGTPLNANIRTDWTNFYNFDTNNYLFWHTMNTDNFAIIDSPYDLRGEFSSVGVCCFVTNNNELCILGIKKSFNSLNNIVYLKTTKGIY